MLSNMALAGQLDRVPVPFAFTWMDEQFNKLLTFLYIMVYKQPVFRPISDKDFQYRNTEYVLISFSNSHCDIVQ